MLFDNDPSDKGLFTFYLEQGLQEQQLQTSKHKHKQDNHEDLTYALPKKSKKDPHKQSLQRHINAHLSKKETASKSKLDSTKQRLLESIVDMGKNTNLEQFKTIHRSPPNPMRTRQFSLIIKVVEASRGTELTLSNSQQNVLYTPELTREEFNLHSFQRHKMTQKVAASPPKQPSGPEREAVFELPAIRSTSEVKREGRPRKSLNSKLIQEALHSGDRARIKQIRQFLHGDSPVISGREQRPPDQPVMRSMRIFEFRQERLLEILRKFKKE